MWEEDPRYQQAQFRFFIGSALAVTLTLSAWTIWERDWEGLRNVWVVVACTVVFFGLYAAAVWLLGHSVRGVGRLIRHRRRRGRHPA